MHNSLSRVTIWSLVRGFQSKQRIELVLCDKVWRFVPSDKLMTEYRQSDKMTENLTERQNYRAKAGWKGRDASKIIRTRMSSMCVGGEIVMETDSC